MRVALLLLSLNNQSEYEPIIASIHMLGQETTTWDYVSTIVVGEYERLRNKSSRTNRDIFNDSGRLVFIARRNFIPRSQRERHRQIIYSVMPVENWSTTQEIVLQ